MKSSQATKRQGFESQKRWVFVSSAAIGFLVGCGSETPGIDEGPIPGGDTVQSTEVIADIATSSNADQSNADRSNADQTPQQAPPELTGGMTLPDDLGTEPPVANEPESIGAGFTLPD